MKKYLAVLALLCVFSHVAQSQELYVSTEPASNMPAKSMSLKLTGRFPEGGSRQRLMPEVMFGINKNWMVHLSTTLSNYYSSNTRFESGRAYAKYRFYSNDDVHKHFRMAAFGDVAFTSNPYLYEEVNLEGDNKGAQIGLIATQLVNKVAVSGTASYTRLFNTDEVHISATPVSYNMLNYTLSAGLLLLPKEYTDYKQTNLNLYMEMLGSKSLDQQHYNVDLAPALQLIFNSNTKINLGYRFQVAGNMTRIANRSFLVGVEHTFFNIWK